MNTTPRRNWMSWLAAACLAIRAESAQDLRITELRPDGTLQWTYPTNGVEEYQVRASTNLVPGAWSNSIAGIAPTGSTMSVVLPMPGVMRFYRVWAVRVQTTPLPPGMVRVPVSGYAMGDSLGEGSADELPVHTVSVGARFVDRYAVTKALWDEVYGWAVTNGYSFTNTAGGKGVDHPVHSVTWYDCVKWCNARSEKQGLTPCYYTGADTATVYRSGIVDVRNSWVRWQADGYRLPTEAEWEKAARGGVAGLRFPWSDTNTIAHSRANYFSTNSVAYTYDVSPTAGYHPAYATNDLPFTSPVGSFAPNGYGLYDMAGNVREWCWDWYSPGYYGVSPSTDPLGPTDGVSRIARGCGWGNSAYSARCAFRFRRAPAKFDEGLGFRCIRVDAGP